MRKILAVLMILVMSVSVSGCAMGPYQELTEEQSNAIAQYSAYLLLKYDRNKKAERKLLDIKEIEDYYEELNGDATPTPVPTKTEEDPAVTGTDPEPTREATPAPTAVVTPTAEPVNDKTVSSLDELYDDPSFGISYGGYDLTKVYEENAYSSFSAKDGEKILVAKFKIQNKTSSKLNVSLIESNVEYYLYCENGDIYSPSISFLQNDMVTLDTEIASGSAYDAVMIFCIKEESKPAVLKAIESESGNIYEMAMN